MHIPEHDDLHEGGRHESWYVPAGVDDSRFIDPATGMPALRLVRYYAVYGEWVLRLCENATGLMIGPTDRRLPMLDVYVAKLRGTRFYREALKAGEFSPGEYVRIRREPDNPFDSNAVAIEDGIRDGVIGYVNRHKARQLAARLDSGKEYRAISLRGSPAGMETEQVTVLITSQHIITHLTSPRPPDSAALRFWPTE